MKAKPRRYEKSSATNDYGLTDREWRFVNEYVAAGSANTVVFPLHGLHSCFGGIIP